MQIKKIKKYVDIWRIEIFAFYIIYKTKIMKINALERISRNDNTGREEWVLEVHPNRMFLVRPSLGEDWQVEDESEVVVYRHASHEECLEAAQDLLFSKRTNNM